MEKTEIEKDGGKYIKEKNEENRKKKEDINNNWRDGDNREKIISQF